MSESAPIYDDKAHVRGNLDLSAAQWLRSDEGAEQEAEHVEIAFVEHTDGVTYTAMRNSAEPDGTVLVFTPAEWEAFILGVKDGEFDEPW
ncbi:DUF397 domain-containing protein [Actinosynnema pretiosum subsp. pretiosum]|uniref:DUF397 domain-containing protein n=2 Tax=Actinosynnema TaxID=40566 RepID=C6WG61_ACTMD|nr:DUF397 domain-containing protein [Actinosynnema mirum]ACU39825.1 protein of unknown function DUF397 [Actinosynnema mirum DSM 43827]AXX33339.1 protein of unknown function DUF397 [Actinosynnema pretiosum subsp. pretiosum]QUF02840.1 DUF397 domain-containing protein [Actinosynnema pretiosum subsp. pretiosum]